MTMSSSKNTIEAEIHPRIFKIRSADNIERPATINSVPGRKVYGERLVTINNVEYRLWDPKRSKLAAVILNGIPSMPIKEGAKVLYLGASTGTTPSHVADIVGDNGVVYAVEFAPRVARNLIAIANDNENLHPIVGDARKPQDYEPYVTDVDVIYCDVAQPNQTEILADNADAFLKEGGSFLFAIKARSIDSAKDPEEIFAIQVASLEKRGYEVKDVRSLMPYDKDHAFVLGKKPEK